MILSLLIEMLQFSENQQCSEFFNVVGNLTILGSRRITNAVSQAKALCAHLFREIYSLIGLPDVITAHMTSFGQPLFRFKPQSGDICDFSLVDPEVNLEDTSLSVEQFGLDLKDIVLQWITHAAVSDRSLLLKPMKQLQSYVILLLHITGGGPGRSADDLLLSHVATTDRTMCIVALTMSQLQVNSLIHKHLNRQTGSLFGILRHPTYTVNCILSLWSVLVSAVKVSGIEQLNSNDLPNSIWMSSMTSEKLIQCWKNATETTFLLKIDWSVWRLVVQHLFCEHSGDLQQFGQEITTPGAQQYAQLAAVDHSTVAKSSVSGILTRNMGHTLATGKHWYLNQDNFTPAESLNANLAWHRLLDIQEIADVSRPVAQFDSLRLCTLKIFIFPRTFLFYRAQPASQCFPGFSDILRRLVPVWTKSTHPVPRYCKIVCFWSGSLTLSRFISWILKNIERIKC